MTSPLATVILCATEPLPAQEDRPGGTVSHESIDSGGSHPSGVIPSALTVQTIVLIPWRWYRANTSARASRWWITAQSGMPALASSTRDNAGP